MKNDFWCIAHKEITTAEDFWAMSTCGWGSNMIFLPESWIDFDVLTTTEAETPFKGLSFPGIDFEVWLLSTLLVFPFKADMAMGGSRRVALPLSSGICILPDCDCDCDCEK